jgi:hypothetical protein
MNVGVDVTVSIRTKVHLWWTWLQIAVRETGAAQRARNNGVSPRSFESADSAKLSVEFQCSLAAIAAVAFAMEALSLELEGAGHSLDTSLFVKPAKTNAGFYIGHRLAQAFRLPSAFATSLPTRLEDLFRLRNDSVHFESQYRAGAHPHPSGTNTAYELTIYTLEESIKVIQLGLDVISHCATSSKAGGYDKAAAAAAQEMPGILNMLNETIRAEHLEGVK